MAMSEMEKVLKSLQETSIVMSGIQERQATAIREHAEWLVAHDKAIVEMRELGRKTDERLAGLGERIDALVSAMGEFLRRQGK